MNGNSDFVTSIFRAPRLVPALFATFLAGLLLLFVGELPEFWERFFLPSLIGYALGAALIGTLHRQIGSFHHTKKIVEHAQDIAGRQGLSDDVKTFLLQTAQTETWIRKRWRRLIVGLHIALLAAFIAYNFWRGVL